ncbi:MAG: M20/M25/M40 family metallo-hydrolase [Microbacteriaceae bacterium]
MATLEPGIRDRVRAHIDEHLEETVDVLSDYVRIPSVSVGDGSGMREAAEFLADRYRAFGCNEVEIVDTETFPGVWAYYDAGAPITILNYTMYDVRSVGDPSAWTRAPFDPVVEPRGELPAVLYGRGAQVPKGSDIAWLAGLEALKAVTGTLPVNIAFLAEGDEILGSISYTGLLERYADRLRDLDALVYLRAQESKDGVVPVRLGYKAFFTFELQVSGSSWGRGPGAMAAHSALRTIVDSPALRLADVIRSLYDVEGGIAVDGWLEHCAPPTIPDADRPLIDALLAHYAGRDWPEIIPALAGTGVTTYARGLQGESVLAEYIYGSALNIQGYHSGYTGPGTRTFTIPERAVARFDARLTTTDDPAVFMALLREHLDSRGFADVEISLLSAYPASRAEVDSSLVGAFLDTVREWGSTPVVWPAQAYGGPWSLVARDGTPIVFGTGIGYGQGVGGPDEFMVVDGGGVRHSLADLALFSADFITEFAARASAQRMSGEQRTSAERDA